MDESGLWEKLNTLVCKRGGQIRSVRGKFPVTLLCPEGSTLPEYIEQDFRFFRPAENWKKGQRIRDQIAFAVEHVGERGSQINSAGDFETLNEFEVRPRDLSGMDA